MYFLKKSSSRVHFEGWVSLFLNKIMGTNHILIFKNINHILIFKYLNTYFAISSTTERIQILISLYSTLFSVLSYVTQNLYK